MIGSTEINHTLMLVKENKKVVPQTPNVGPLNHHADPETMEDPILQGEVAGHADNEDDIY
jgi:hypothetical protein